MSWLHIVLFVLSLLLITLVMVQESKDDVKNTFSGEKSDLFKNQKQRGSELIMTRVTLGVTGVWVIVSVLALVL
ncbi:preprotein translocase subunit SecG [Mycoplasmatota bacterium WC30]